MNAEGIYSALVASPTVLACCHKSGSLVIAAQDEVGWTSWVLCTLAHPVNRINIVLAGNSCAHKYYHDVGREDGRHGTGIQPVRAWCHSTQA